MVHSRKNSGQILVITSLVVVLLLLSTVVYVTETQKNTPVYRGSRETGYQMLKQTVLHTVTSALANITQNGNSDVLSEDLTRFKSVINNEVYNALVDVQFELVNTDDYVSGVRVYSGSDGAGVASIALKFKFNSTGPAESQYFEYFVNVTSSVTFAGSYIQLNETHRQVTAVCNVFDGNSPAEASVLTFYYYQNQDPAGWIQASPLNVINYGNGTYTSTFLTQNCTLPNLPVSVHCQDFRAISTWANTTCSALP